MTKSDSVKLPREGCFPSPDQDAFHRQPSEDWTGRCPKAPPDHDAHCDEQTHHLGSRCVEHLHPHAACRLLQHNKTREHAASFRTSPSRMNGKAQRPCRRWLRLEVPPSDDVPRTTAPTPFVTVWRHRQLELPAPSNRSRLPRQHPLAKKNVFVRARCLPPVRFAWHATHHVRDLGQSPRHEGTPFRPRSGVHLGGRNTPRWLDRFPFHGSTRFQARQIAASPPASTTGKAHGFREIGRAHV